MSAAMVRAAQTDVSLVETSEADRSNAPEISRQIGRASLQCQEKLNAQLGATPVDTSTFDALAGLNCFQTMHNLQQTKCTPLTAESCRKIATEEVDSVESAWNLDLPANRCSTLGELPNQIRGLLFERAQEECERAYNAQLLKAGSEFVERARSACAANGPTVQPVPLISENFLVRAATTMPAAVGLPQSIIASPIDPALLLHPTYKAGRSVGITFVDVPLFTSSARITGRIGMAKADPENRLFPWERTVLSGRECDPASVLAQLPPELAGRPVVSNDGAIVTVTVLPFDASGLEDPRGQSFTLSVPHQSAFREFSLLLNGFAAPTNVTVSLQVTDAPGGPANKVSVCDLVGIVNLQVAP